MRTAGCSPCRVTMRLATACTELNSTRGDCSGASRRNSDRYTGSNVPRYEVTSTESPRAARYLARCRASTVLPVPAAPRIRAGPARRRRTCWAWSGCNQVIQTSTGSRAAASTNPARNPSRSISAGRDRPPGPGRGSATEPGGDAARGSARSSAGSPGPGSSTTRSITAGGSRRPRRTRSTFRSSSPVSTTRPSAPRAFRRPASTSSGTTSVGGSPSAASSCSTASVWSSSLRTSSSASASPRHSRPPSSRTSRQFFTSTTKTPPGPTSSTSMLARRVPGQCRSASTCQPASSMPIRTRTTPSSARPPAAQFCCWRRRVCSIVVSSAICRSTASASRPNSTACPKAELPGSAWPPTLSIALHSMPDAAGGQGPDVSRRARRAGWTRC